MNIAVCHHQILALDQFDAHLLGKEGVLEIGTVVDAGGEHPDGRLLQVIRGQVFEHLQQLVGVIVHGPDLRCLEHLGESAFEDLAIFKDVGDAGGATEIVLEHIEATVPVANQIGAGDMTPYATRRGEALALLAVGAAAEDQIFGHDFIFQDFFVVIDVLEKFVEGKNSLFETVFDLLPIACRNDAGDDIKGEDFFGALVAAVNIKGDAHFEEQGLCRLLAHGEIPGRKRFDFVDQNLGAGSRGTVMIDQLVKKVPRIIGAKGFHTVLPP